MRHRQTQKVSRTNRFSQRLRYPKKQNRNEYEPITFCAPNSYLLEGEPRITQSLAPQHNKKGDRTAFVNLQNYIELRNGAPPLAVGLFHPNHIGNGRSVAANPFLTPSPTTESAPCSPYKGQSSPRISPPPLSQYRPFGSIFLAPPHLSAPSRY